MSEPLVILVDQNDNEIGQMNKLEAHEKGLLHRAISVLIFNSKGEWLLQKRASSKYHSPSLWTNSCCSHPYPKERTIEAASRRLVEEMGLKTKLESSFNFTYKVSFSNGLIENEFDHVFIGITNTLPIINPDEVEEFKYVDEETLLEDVKINPSQYTEWFKIMIPQILKNL